MYELEIEGKPIPLQRHRMGRGFSYDPQAKVKQDLLNNLQPALKYLPCIDGEPIAMNMTFVFEHPKHKSKKWKRENAYRISRPDLDNLCKLPGDLFNGILWRDDSQIIHLTAKKIYGMKEKTILRWSIL